MNPYLDRWLEAIGEDTTVSPEATLFGSTIAKSVGIGRVALTNWQWVNVSLGRERRDPAVLASVRELQSAGYLGRFQGNRYHKSRGWRLTLPGEVE